MWQVLIVEDDEEMRHFFADCVQRCPDLGVAACFGTLSEAQLWLNSNAVWLDVLLTDLGLPDGSGLELIRQATRLNPACESLVISMFGDDANVLASIEAGALGYIHKDSAPEDIARTILDMRRGASPISPMIARRVLLKYRLNQSEVHQSSGIDTPLIVNDDAVFDSGVPVKRAMLSPREHEVLSLISRGFSYVEIAGLQGISVHTVQSHIKNLYAKLSVHSKNEAVFEAARMGYLGGHAT